MGAGLVLVLVGLGALAIGILVGRYYQPDDRNLRREARRGRDYIRALSHVVARDDVRAIAILRGVVEADNVPEIEPYFALGALFRSRGEHERAIRVHQAIAVHEADDRKLRLRALYELGLDYRAAGMPMRATRALEDCLDRDSRHEGAMRGLYGLYDAQGRYGEAADLGRRLCKLLPDGPERRRFERREPHLLVAAADNAIARGDIDTARRRLREARKVDGDSAHHSVIAAELAAARGNAKGASAQLVRALELAPELASFLVPGLVAAERNRLPAGDPGHTDDSVRHHDAVRHAIAAITKGVSTAAGANPHLLLAVAELRAHVDPAAAMADYRAIADQFPDSLPARVSAARVALSTDDAAAAVAELRALVAPAGPLAWATDRVWRCTCGARADQFTWRCTSCFAWNTLHPEVGRDALPPPRPRPERPLLRRIPEDSLLGEARDRALPAPIVDSGLSDDEMRDAARKPTALGRLTGWLSDTFRGRSERDLAERELAERELAGRALAERALTAGTTDATGATEAGTATGAGTATDTAATARAAAERPPAKHSDRALASRAGPADDDWSGTTQADRHQGTRSAAGATPDTDVASLPPAPRPDEASESPS